MPDDIIEKVYQSSYDDDCSCDLRNCHDMIYISSVYPNKQYLLLKLKNSSPFDVLYKLVSFFGHMISRVAVLPVVLVQYIIFLVSR